MHKTKREDQFVSFIGEHDSIIRSVSRVYVGSDVDEEADLYQDIVCQLWRKWHLFRGESKSSTWVYRVALNCARTYNRKKKRHPNTQPYPQNMFVVPSQMDEKVLMIDALYELINRLKPQDKDLIYLYLNRLPINEIAQITHLTPTAIAKRIVRLKQTLREMWNEEESL